MAPPFVGNLLLFGRLLRRAGVRVHTSRVMDALRALELVGVRRRQDVHGALRALLVHRHEDLARFDAAFDLWFRAPDRAALDLPLFSLGERPRVTVRPPERGSLPVEIDSEASGDADSPASAVAAYSPTAVSRTKDFAEFTPEELEQARRQIAGLPWHLGVRRTRRYQPAGGARVDLRRLLRRSLTRGDLVQLAFRQRHEAPRPIVIIGDVSGSMERYSRMLLFFIWTLAHQARHLEGFVFSTSLTRITPRLMDPAREDRLNRLIRRVADWGGGTRIGEALHAFNTEWARRVMRHGPVVLLVSDGWDRGDPALLARELARVRRMCRRLIWLNPLLGSAGYEPLTRGMQAALPHVDDFLSIRNLASFEDLAVHLRRLSGAGHGRRAGVPAPRIRS
jgi:uncharacterized protein